MRTDSSAAVIGMVRSRKLRTARCHKAKREIVSAVLQYASWLEPIATCSARDAWLVTLSLFTAISSISQTKTRRSFITISEDPHWFADRRFLSLPCTWFCSPQPSVFLFHVPSKSLPGRFTRPSIVLPKQWNCCPRFRCWSFPPT